MIKQLRPYFLLLLFIICVCPPTKGQLYDDLDSLRLSLKKTKNHLFKLKTKIAIAQYYLETDVRVSRKIMDSVNTIVESRGYNSLIPELSLLKATYYTRIYDHNNARYNLELAFKMFGNPQTYEEANYLGWCYAQEAIFQKNIDKNQERAMDAFESAYNIFNEIGNDRLASFALTSIAFIYIDLGLLEEAFALFNRALSILSVKNHSMALIYRQLGLISTETRDLTKAQRYLTKALRIYTDKELVKRAAVYEGLASVYNLKNEMQVCFEHQNKAVSIYKTYNKLSKYLGAVYKLSQYLIKDRQKDLAITYLTDIINNKAYEIYKPYYDDAALLLASIYLSKNRIQEAQQIVKKSIERNLNIESEIKALKLYSLILKKLGDVHSSLNYLERYADKLDSISQIQDTLRRENIKLTIRTHSRIKTNELAIQLQEENEKKEKEQQKKIKVYQSIGAGLLMSMLLLFLWVKYSIKKKDTTIKQSNVNLSIKEDELQTIESKLETTSELITRNNIHIFGSRIAKKLTEELNTPIGSLKINISQLFNYQNINKNLFSALKSINVDDLDFINDLVKKVDRAEFGLSTRQERQLSKQLKKHIETFNPDYVEKCADYIPSLVYIKDEKDVLKILRHSRMQELLVIFEYLIGIKKLSNLLYDTETVIVEKVHQLQGLEIDDYSDSNTSYNLKTNLTKIFDLIKLNYTRNIEISIALSQDVTIITKKVLLNSIWVTILKNAVEAVPLKREVYIQVRVEKKNNRYIISFQDNGEGIPIAQRNQVFEANPLKSKTKPNSSGISLALARNTIKSLNGDIWFETNSSGSIFYVSIEDRKK